MKLFNLTSVLILAITQTHALALTPALALNSTTNRVSLRDAAFYEVARITQKYRYTIFHELEATASRPTSNPDDLKDVRLIFSADEAAHLRIIVSMIKWGIWGPPEFVPYHKPEKEGALPYRLRLDIRDADAKMKRAGFTGRYHALDVKQCLVHGHRLQPWWIFLMEGQNPSFVWVGDRSGDVIPGLGYWRAVEGRNGSLSIAR